MQHASGGNYFRPFAMAENALDAWTLHVTAACGSARPCRLDGSLRTRRAQGPVLVRCKTREALKHSRYLRAALLVNLRRLARRTDKLDQMSRGLCLPAATHLGIASGKHLFDLEPTPSLPLKLTSSQPCSAAGFGCFGCMWWLQELGGWQRRGQLFGTLAMVDVIAATVADAAWLSIDEAERRFCDLSRRGRPCSRCMILVSCSGSCARLPQAFRTLGGSIRTCVASRTRTCAAAVATWPL